jgi:hypothetical protein
MRAILAVACVASLCACNANAPIPEDEPRLPFVMSLVLDEVPPELAPYGTKDEWRRDVLDVFEASRLCHALQGADAAGSPDVTITLNLRAVADARTEIDVPAAVVTTLAWSCVPPLHFFVRDVAVFPDVCASVKWTGTAADARTIPPQGPFYASYLQRYPFFSWETLGSILIPSFVFSGGDREHMLSAIAARVRGDVARRIAKELRGGVLRADDLLKNPELYRTGDTLTLQAEPSAVLYKITLRLDDDAAPFDQRILPLVLRSEMAAPLRIRIDCAKFPAAPRPTLLHITAEPRTIGGRIEHYTLRIDDNGGARNSALATAIPAATAPSGTEPPQ